MATGSATSTANLLDGYNDDDDDGKNTDCTQIPGYRASVVQRLEKSIWWISH